MQNFNKDVRVFDKTDFRYFIANYHDSMNLPKYRHPDHIYDDKFEYTTNNLNSDTLNTKLNNLSSKLDMFNITGINTTPDFKLDNVFYFGSQNSTNIKTYKLHKVFEIPYVYSDVNNFQRQKFEGITKVNGVETSCKVYLFDENMNEISKTISDSSGFYSFDHVKDDANYHIVCIPFTTECPQISKLINPTV